MTEPWEDRFLDDVLPDGLDWRRTVLTYPRLSLLAAMIGGFFLGRFRGEVLLASIGLFASRRATEAVDDFLGRAAD